MPSTSATIDEGIDGMGFFVHLHRLPHKGRGADEFNGTIK